MCIYWRLLYTQNFFWPLSGLKPGSLRNLVSLSPQSSSGCQAVGGLPSPPEGRARVNSALKARCGPLDHKRLASSPREGCNTGDFNPLSKAGTSKTSILLRLGANVPGCQGLQSIFRYGNMHAYKSQNRNSGKLQ